MAKGWEDLPEECWEAIFDRLKSDQNDLESLSLVCKRFLSISNRLLSTFNISDRMVILHPGDDSYPFFRRFHFIKRIHLKGFHGDLDRLIRDISRSDLRLEALDLSDQERLPVSGIQYLGSRMKETIKTLICARIHCLEDRDLITIADSLPALEELDISYPYIDEDTRNRSPALVTDSGILELSLKLQKLRSINLAGNIFISDNSLVALSSNCPLLSEISAKECSFITSDGINFVIRHSLNLRSLLVDGSLMSFSSPDIVESFCSYARTLSRLELYQMSVSDDLLFAIGETKLPLQKLVLSFCRGFTFIGISRLLRLCRSLHYFDLKGMDSLTDEEMSILSEHLQCLISIGLSSCIHLTNSTFFNLAKNCPSLEEIRMEASGLGKEDSVMDVGRNCRIHSLKLGWNEYLSDETLERIGTVCPELRLLDVSHCWGITGVGLSVIGKCCTEIRELRVGGCTKVQSLGSSSEFSNLEVLIAYSTDIGDEGLGMIGRGCPRLRVLDLNGCLSLTDKGLQELTKSDSSGKVLRKLNINNCCNVRGDFLARMVFSSPSLKTIVAPASSIPTTKQRDLFLRHGCLVTDNGRHFHREPQKVTFWLVESDED